MCKIIRADRRKSADENLSDFNDNLKKTAAKEVDQKGDYSRVDLDIVGFDQSCTKLVTTYREKSTSIVKLHSKLIMDGLGVTPKPTYDDDIQRRVQDIDHFAYLHDVHADRPFDEQLKLELPHKRTRAEWFRKHYFDIQAGVSLITLLSMSQLGWVPHAQMCLRLAIYIRFLPRSGIRPAAVVDGSRTEILNQAGVRLWTACSSIRSSTAPLIARVRNRKRPVRSSRTGR